MKKNVLNQKYEIVKPLGSGGMSNVYLCKDITSGNEYAVKVMKNTTDNLNLEAEWYVLKSLNHRGIPKAIDFFIENENFYLVEEYIEGSTLQSIIENLGEVNNVKLMDIFFQTCDILSYLHGLNPPLIYRDMKPSNIMLTPSNDVKLLDFGISRLYKEDKTTDTVFMGSKGYAAPEQYGLSQSEKATDVYGVGAVLFFMITGHAPKDIMEPLKESSYKQNTPKQLINIIQKAMQVEIKNRFSSIDEFRDEMNKYVNTYSESSDNFATQILNNDKTQIISENSDESNTRSVKVVRRFNHKKAGLIIGLLIFTMVSIKTLLTYFYKEPVPSTASNAIKEKPEVKVALDTESPKDSNMQVEKQKKEVLIEGILIRSSPTKITELKDSNDDDDKGKGNYSNKNKKKDDSDSNNEKIFTYELITAAEVVKNEDFTIKLTRLDFIKDYTIAYCYIENNTNKTLALKYDYNTYILSSKGEKSLPIPSASTDLSNIKSKTRINNAVIYFKGSNLQEEKLTLRTNIDFNDKLYNNNINLIVNIK